MRSLKHEQGDSEGNVPICRHNMNESPPVRSEQVRGNAIQQDFECCIDLSIGMSEQELKLLEPIDLRGVEFGEEEIDEAGVSVGEGLFEAIEIFCGGWGETKRVLYDFY